MTFRSRALVGTAMLLIGAPGAALAADAQQAATPATSDSQPAAASSQPASTAASAPAASPAATQQDEDINAIVVTAQRRSENLQDVPISVGVLTAESAQRSGVVGTESLSVAAPGLDFSRNAGNGGVPFLRGVGSTQAAAGAESPVAVYVDDVYIGAPAANLFSFNNIDQVEILRGPQGTLFGRNATGGVIQIRTRRPSHDFHLDASGTYGNFDTVSGNLYVTGGLTDTLAVNFAAVGSNQGDGYGRNTNLNEDTLKESGYGFRAGALWQPTSRTTLLLLGDISVQHSELGLNPTTNPGARTGGGGVFTGRYENMASSIDAGRSEQGGVSLRIDQELGFANLVSISAARYSDLHYTLDQDGGPAFLVLSDTSARTRTLSQEVQLQSLQSSKVRWIAGLYYFRQNAGFDPLRALGTSQGANVYVDVNDSQILNSYAGFGEVSYEFLPATRLTAGLRYTSDHYSLDVLRTTASGAIPAGGQFSQSDTFSRWTYRAILDHRFSDHIMAYASYSRGFKSGGFNVASPGVAPGAPPVSPEILDAYEVGLKTNAHNVRLNLSAFHYDYSNLQVLIIGTASSIVLNAASARIQGVEADFEAQLTRNFTVSAGASFLDGKYTSFPNGPLYVPAPGVCLPTPQSTGAPTGGNLQCAGDLSGNTTVRTPKFTGYVTATYTVPTAIGEVAFNGSIYHNSGFFWEPDNRTRQPEHDLLNLSATWTSSSGRYELRVWGRNLLNEYYATFGSESALRDSSSPAPPRTYGVTAGVHF